MKEKIVQTPLGITIIGAGRVRDGQLTRSRQLAPFVVAADGGLRHVRKSGFVADAVIGDLDGVRGIENQIAPERIHRIDEQDSTDFEKCLYATNAPFVIAHGVTGSRFDHSLAAMNALVKYAAMPVIVVSGKDLIFVCPASLHLSLPVGTRLSLFPMARVCGTSDGLKYPVNGIGFSPTGRIGTSNQTDAAQVRLSFAKPRMLVILPWKHLETVVGALTLAMSPAKSMSV